MEVSNIISPYESLLNTYNQMDALQLDLQLELAHGHKKRAEADINQLIGLDRSMGVLAHEAPIPGGLVQSLSDMEGNLGIIMQDVQSGNFSEAKDLNNTFVKGDLATIFSKIAI